MALYKNQELYKALKELGVIEEKQLDEAYKKAEQNKALLGDLLLQNDLISDHNLGKALSELKKIPLIRLESVTIPQEILKIIPEVTAKNSQMVAFKKDGQGLYLAMVNPADKNLIEFVSKKTGLRVFPYLATKEDINNALSLYAKDVGQAFEEIISESVKKTKDLKGKEVEPPIIKIVNTILSYAYKNKASDIHIEPEDDYSVVRFRIDGMLHDIVKLPVDLHPQIIIRIKVLAKLRTDEHQSAQDGKIEWTESASVGQGERLDIRVSIVPVTDGEKVVMRLLSEGSRQFTLSSLGLNTSNLKKVESAYKKPHGMILATGPTGCGKTTTMYSILKILNKRNVNIMTIEDPVEYDIEGVNQIQVNVKTKLTFASGLRSIVRQDPDIILVGEIRDEETAGIAVNSAMTGHLVLSTLHTNDAATSIPRLYDMKVQPFLIASSINIIIAQRLVRKICQKCRISHEINPQKTNLSPEVIKKHFGETNLIRAYHGKGCPICRQSGYVGRIGIFEVLTIDEEIRQAIVSRKDASEIRQIAIKNGMKTMNHDGIEKVKQGITTIEEVVRTTKD